MNKNRISNYMLSTKTNVRFKHRYRLRVKRWKKISHANCNQKRAGGPIKTLDKTDFKTKMLT